jgi:ABC-type multidrug transport system fused ATPase/permease subunit
MKMPVSTNSLWLTTVFPAKLMPETLLLFVRRFSSWHQIALAAMSILIFLLDAAPLEIQRRIVNGAVKGGDYRPILVLSLIYVGLALTQGFIKLLMNIYRSWVGEKAVRSLRLTVQTLTSRMPVDRAGAEDVGIENSMMLAEADAIGGFVGVYTSEPLLQGGLLLTVAGYMVFIQPSMALVALLMITPQLIFVPLMQAAINRRVTTRIKTLRAVSGGIIWNDVDGQLPGGLQGQRIDDIFSLNMGIFELKFSMNFLMNLLNQIGTAGVLGVGGWFVVSGQTEVGTVVAFLSGLSRISEPWSELVNWFRDLTVTGAKYRLIARAIRDIDIHRVDILSDDNEHANPAAND